MNRYKNPKHDEITHDSTHKKHTHDSTHQKQKKNSTGRSALPVFSYSFLSS